MEMLLGIHRARQTTLVLVTHDADLAALADVRLVLRDGRPVHLQTPAVPDVEPRVSSVDMPITSRVER
jgi:ABC-type lipoprotein export system ATPase subunit